MVALHIRCASTARCLALLLLVVIAQRIAAQAAELRSFGLEVACQSMQRTRGVQRRTCNMTTYTIRRCRPTALDQAGGSLRIRSCDIIVSAAEATEALANLNRLPHLARIVRKT